MFYWHYDPAEADLCQTAAKLGHVTPTCPTHTSASACKKSWAKSATSLFLLEVFTPRDISSLFDDLLLKGNKKVHFSPRIFVQFAESCRWQPGTMTKRERRRRWKRGRRPPRPPPAPGLHSDCSAPTLKSKTRRFRRRFYRLCWS